ncbi:DUF1538 domain-containing protein [Methanosarcina sp. MSH10X1]|uniref:DUF1538 domain-containing protein n=1 Tax=Methanosarcina sp. MSH10X1 TaxID=2507075 RepID=UPI000FFCBE6B|nr:DUF1538 domain-containing protein [Methanosarcina sp. MSH10X1]RXA18966.1 DUF1538 domain-containing protein [Methanosarcina sp. MSH10X1]
MMRGIKETFLEVTRAVFPLTLAVVLLLLLFVGISLNNLISFLIATILTAIGMTFFLTGVKLSMLPIGEAIGGDLPKHNSLAFIALVVFLLSSFVAVAEPNVSVLIGMIDSALQGSIDNNLLVISIACGVGILMVISILRIIYGTPIKYLFAVIYSFILVLSFFISDDYLAIAFDSGSVTTGAMFVPVLMGLGIGIASVLQDRSELDGFGLVGLATTGPIISIMLMGVLSS